MFHPWGIEETKVNVSKTKKSPDPNKWSPVKEGMNGGAGLWWKNSGKAWGDSIVRGRVETGKSKGNILRRRSRVRRTLV